MLLYLRYGDSQVWIRYENLVEQVSELLRNQAIVLWLAQTYLLVDLLSVFGAERSLARYYLHNEHTQTPNIDLIRVAGSSEYLGGDVDWCSAVGHSLLIIPHLFREPEIDQFYVASVVLGNNDVLGLQVSVYYPMSVQEFKGQNDFARIEMHIILDLFVVFADLAEHGTSLDILQLKIKVVFVLERAVNTHDERTLIVHFGQVLKDFTFGDDVIDLFHLGNVVLFETLERTHPLCLLVVGSNDFPEIANTNNFMELELGDFGLVCLFYPHFTGPLCRLIVELGIIEFSLHLTGLFLLLDN